jgi:hypothetical protein
VGGKSCNLPKATLLEDGTSKKSLRNCAARRRKTTLKMQKQFTPVEKNSRWLCNANENFLNVGKFVSTSAARVNITAEELCRGDTNPLFMMHVNEERVLRRLRKREIELN